MIRVQSPSQFALALVAAIGLALVHGPMAVAQPGPVGPPSTSATGPALMPAPTNQLTPEALTSYLRQRNHKVEPTKGADGRPILLVQILQDGWKFDLEIEFQPNLLSFFVTCPLGKAGTPMSSAQLTELLKANFRYTPDYFVIRGGDHRLALETNTGAQMNTATFQAILNRFLGNVRGSQATWDSSRWPINGGIATGPVAGMQVP